MGDIQSQARVLESTDEALLQQQDVAGGTEEVEFADLATMKPGESVQQSTEKTAADAAAATAAAGKQTATQQTAVEEDDVPTEFRGKSKKDIVKMYQDAHKVIGRQGSELGELRQKADFAIKASLEALRGRKVEEKPATGAQAAAATAQPGDESEFFAKPFDAVNKAIESNPVIREIRETLGRAAAETATHRAAAATERFNRAHPDAAEILRNEEFREWVQASPIRRVLLQRAHANYDFESGDEVFSTWKALRGTKQAASKAGEQSGQQQPAAGPTQAEVSAAAATLASQRKAKADAAAKAAAVPTGGASGAAKQAAGKKVFRRADVIRLMQEDPDRYEALSDEISLAYAEGRVR